MHAASWDCFAEYFNHTHLPTSTPFCLNPDLSWDYIIMFCRILQHPNTPIFDLTSTTFCLNPDLSTWCKGIMNTIGRVLIARFFWLQIASFCPQLKITVKGLLNEYYTYHTTSACQSLIDRAPMHWSTIFCFSISSLA